MSENLKRHRPDIKVLGEGKAISFMPEDPMGVWVHIQEVRDLLDVKDKVIAELKRKLQDQCMSCPVKMQEDDVVAEKDNEIRRLKRALYKACANWADLEVFDRTVCIDDPNVEANRWALMRNKCLKKSKEYL